MRNVAQQRQQRMRRRLATALIATVTTVTFLPGAASATATVNLSFTQWWASQMAGHNSLQNLVNQFEQQNPGIHVTLETAPYPTWRARPSPKRRPAPWLTWWAWMVPGSIHLSNRERSWNLSAATKETGFDQKSIKSQVKAQR